MVCNADAEAVVEAVDSPIVFLFVLRASMSFCIVSISSSVMLANAFSSDMFVREVEFQVLCTKEISGIQRRTYLGQNGYGL